MEILFTSLIIILIMLFFVYILFKNIIKKINQNSKKFFVNKLNDYDYIVEEKENKIEELNKKIDELKETKEKLENDKVFQYSKLKKRKVPLKQFNLVEKVPKYREENFFDNYKELRKNFNFDVEELIKEFIKEFRDKKDEKTYKILINFKNKFDKDAIYHLMTLPGEEQFDILKNIMTEKEKEAIDIDNIVEDIKKFNIVILFKKIDENLINVDPIMRIFVNRNDKNYDYIDPYIKTFYYERMSEGVIIEYKGKSYDFSI